MALQVDSARLDEGAAQDSQGKQKKIDKFQQGSKYSGRYLMGSWIKVSIC